MSQISTPLGERRLDAALQVPREPSGVAVFVHGSGVDRYDVRDRYVARKLRQAGFATLQALTPEAYERLDALGERLRGGVTRLFEGTRRKGQVTGIGSLFCLHWVTGELTDYRSSRPKDPEAPMRTFLALLNEGVILSQRGLGACSLAMGDEDVDRFVNALARVLARTER